MINDKGTTQSISFTSSELELYNQVRLEAKHRFGGNISALIIDALKCRNLAIKKYGDWRQMEDVPGWAKELLNEDISK